MGQELAKVMRSFATGVCVVSTYTDASEGREHDAVTVNALTSVSLDPPLVSVYLRRDSRFLTDLLATGVCAVSILDSREDQTAQDLATDRPSRTTALRRLPATPGERTGALVLRAASWLECAVHEWFDTGDRTAVIGQVLATGSGERCPPLIYLYGRYNAVGGQREVTPTAHPVSAVDVTTPHRPLREGSC